MKIVVRSSLRKKDGFVLRNENVKNGFVLRDENVEDGFHGTNDDLRPNLWLRRSKMGVPRSSESKNEDGGGSSKMGILFEKRGRVLINSRFSKNPYLRRTFFFEEPPIFVLRLQRPKNPPHIRSSELKIEKPHLQPSIFHPEDRRTPSSIFGSEELVEDRTEEERGRGLGLLRRWKGRVFQR